MRMLTWLSAQYNFIVHAEHVPGKLNDMADALSRFQMKKFRPPSPKCRVNTHALPPNTGINEVLKDNTEDLWKFALSLATLRTYKVAFNLYVKFLVLCNLYVQVAGSVPPISEDIIIKFVIYCADILHLKWNPIKLYLAGVEFHFIKAGYGKPLEYCNKLSYIIKAVRR